jgi:hypothetical protein
MLWKSPTWLEIKMDAEISSYQEDEHEPLRDGPTFGAPAHSDGAAESDVRVSE